MTRRHLLSCFVGTALLCVCVLVHPSIALGQVLKVNDKLKDPSGGDDLTVTQILNQSAIVTHVISLPSTDPNATFEDPNDPTRTLTIFSSTTNKLTGVVREVTVFGDP